MRPKYPMDSTSQTQPTQEEFSLGEIFAFLWKGKWLILVVTLAFALVAAIGAWLMPKSYKTTVLLSPVSASSGSQLGALGSLASQFGGLASLAGLSGSGDLQRSESIAVLQSEALTEKYIQDNDLLPILFKNKWNAQEKKWKEKDPKKIPTLWTANLYFKRNVRSVTVETKTGLVTLAITFDDPRIAAKWANDLVQMTNDFRRNRAIEEANRNIAYLNEQAAKTNVVEVRQAIYKILENEINKEMLARGNNEYAFKILDPAIAPEKPSSPQKLLWIIGGLAFGSFASGLFVVMRASRNPTR
jgi:uncharacterized protein involved in exopolysaccharide biosynthesis